MVSFLNLPLTNSGKFSWSESRFVSFVKSPPTLDQLQVIFNKYEVVDEQCEVRVVMVEISVHAVALRRHVFAVRPLSLYAMAILDGQRTNIQAFPWNSTQDA